MLLRSRFKSSDLRVPPGRLGTGSYFSGSQLTQHAAIAREQRKTRGIPIMRAVLLACSWPFQSRQDASDHCVEMQQEMTLRSQWDIRRATGRIYAVHSELHVLHESISRSIDNQLK